MFFNKNIYHIQNNLRHHYFEYKDNIHILYLYTRSLSDGKEFVDDNDNLINFNGLASYFTFQFDIYRKPFKKNITFRELMNQLNPVLN
jgi:hypothetical protein